MIWRSNRNTIPPLPLIETEDVYLEVVNFYETRERSTYEVLVYIKILSKRKALDEACCTIATHNV